MLFAKKSAPVLILVKKDPKKPFGRFTLQLLFQETDEADPSTLEFDEDSNPYTYEFALSNSADDEYVETPADVSGEDSDADPHAEYD